MFTLWPFTEHVRQPPLWSVPLDELTAVTEDVAKSPDHAEPPNSPAGRSAPSRADLLLG